MIISSRQLGALLRPKGKTLISSLTLNWYYPMRLIPRKLKNTNKLRLENHEQLTRTFKESPSLVILAMQTAISYLYIFFLNLRI